MKDMLSMVIITLNEEKRLPLLLESIKKQKYKDYEIIVSDAKSKDDTLKIAKSYGCKITNGGLPGIGRNNGAKIAKGDSLLFLDADVILPENFLIKFIDQIKKNKAAVASCRFIPDSNKIHWRVGFFISAVYLWILQYFNPIAIGSVFYVKKEIFDNMKGFDPKIKLGEDVDFVRKAFKKNKYCYFFNITAQVSARRLEKDGFSRLVKTGPKTIFKFIFDRNYHGHSEYEYWGYTEK